MKSIITLKKLAFIALCSVLLISNVRAHSDFEIEADTIILEFGNNSKILILVENQEDLKSLQSYDINQMLKDLSVSIDSAEEEVDYLTIEDNEGDRYLRDTTIVVRNRRSERYSDRDNDGGSEH